MKSLKNFIKIALLTALVYVRLFVPLVWKKVADFHPAIELIINYLIFVLAIHLCVVFLSHYYRKWKKFTTPKSDNVLNGLRNLYYLVLTSATILTILGFWNIDVKTLFTTLSIVAAAIAIITKDYLAEIISGTIISFSSVITIGDYVKIGEHKGEVLEINLTKIALMNEDDDVVYIPNNKVFMSEIVNFTRRQIQKVNIEFELNLKFLDTIEELETDLIQCLADYHEQIDKEQFNLRIVSITKESLLLKFQFQLNQVSRQMERELRKMTVRRVVNYIKNRQTPQQWVAEES